MLQLEEFLSNCVQCKRYKDGKCSLLVKAKEGRIQEDIQELQCSKFKLYYKYKYWRYLIC